jgi:thymidylate synthase (FAD)
MDPRFRVELIAATPNPQQCVYAGMHQDYSEGFVANDRASWPDETRAGEICVKRLLAGERGHYGPLEHAQIVLNVGWFPHSVMQQARTHRVGVSFDVQCLAADTEITFLQSSGALRKIRIAELHDLWTHGERAHRPSRLRGLQGEEPGSYRRDCRRRLQKMKLRVLNEDTGVFETSHIREVICSGLQPVYRLTMEDGRTLDCTANHRLFTPEGWQTMGEAMGLRTRPDGSVHSFRRSARVMANGMVAAGSGSYRDRQWLREQIDSGTCVGEMADRAGCSATTIRVWARRHQLHLPQSDSRFKPGQKPWNHIPAAPWRNRQPHAHPIVPVHADPGLAHEFNNLVSLCQPRPQGRKLRAHPLAVTNVEYLGEQITYDLEVQEPWHNFVANGLVVHNSMRYTGERICRAARGELELEEVFYLRPVGDYADRQGKKYHYGLEQRAIDLELCRAAAERYRDLLEAGYAEEHARGILPFDYRQHFVVSFSLRAFLHFLDLRAKLDAQQEIRALCDLMWPHLQSWAPEFADWYQKSRLHKARLAP